MRMLGIACLLACGVAAGPAAAENHAVKEAFKKTEKGMGRLLEAMGQETRKLAGAAKKDEKKPAKSHEKKQK